MNLGSLALKTDLVMSRFSGVIIDRGDYLVVRTPSRPDYYWGNYLIMSHPPGPGDLDRWVGLFEKEIGPRNERGFMAITWDATDGDPGVIGPFEEFGFSIQKSTILTARSVRRPPKFNPDLMVRPFDSDRDWEDFIGIHFDPDWGYGRPAVQNAFLRDSRDAFREIVDAGHGMRFGVVVDGKLIGDAGLYRCGKLGRFNSVATHREFRRQGICSTLVHAASKFAFETWNLETLVMEADEEYHAAKIYESVGFTPTERVVKLEWRAES